MYYCQYYQSQSIYLQLALTEKMRADIKTWKLLGKGLGNGKETLGMKCAVTSLSASLLLAKSMENDIINIS